MRLSLCAAGLVSLFAVPVAAQVLPGGHHINTNEVATYKAQVRMQAMALTGRWAAAFTKDDADGLAALYAKDAVLLGANGAVARSRKEIQENLRRAVPLIGGVQIAVDDFDLSGEMAYIAGRFTYDVEQKGGGILREVGPFSMVLRRDFATSDWQIRSHNTPGPLVDGETASALPVALSAGPIAPAEPDPAEVLGDLLRQAAEHFERARAAQKADDWTTYGTEMRRLGEILRKAEAERGTTKGVSA